MSHPTARNVQEVIVGIRSRFSDAGGRLIGGPLGQLAPGQGLRLPGYSVASVSRSGREDHERYDFRRTGFLFQSSRATSREARVTTNAAPSGLPRPDSSRALHDTYSARPEERRRALARHVLRNLHKWGARTPRSRYAGTSDSSFVRDARLFVLSRVDLRANFVHVEAFHLADELVERLRGHHAREGSEQ